MDNTDFEIIFKDITMMNSVGLFFCLYTLKQNLDTATYTNIMKELKKLSSAKATISDPNQKADCNVVKEPVHDTLDLVLDS